MHFQRAWALGAAVLCGWCVSIAAQSNAKPITKNIAQMAYCHPAYGFCFKYPATWAVLGEVFDGNGVVVAPTQPQAREDWNEVTVALVIPPPEGDAEPVTIEEAITQAVSGVRKNGQAFETLQRQQRTVDGQPAELLKLKYIEQGKGTEWVEDLVFIQGPESEIYSVALKCSPSSLAGMEPMFARIVDSWRAPGSETTDAAAETSQAAPKTPAKSSAPKSSAPPKQ